MGWYEYDSDNGYEYFEPSEYYAVAIGRNPGIYTTQDEAVEQISAFPGYRMRKFEDYEDARDYLIDFEVFCDSETEGSDQEDEDELESDEWFYAVAVGRSTGVFLNLDDAESQILGYPRARMNQFLDYEDAERFVENYHVFTIEEEEKTEKPENKRKSWFYAVAVGRSTGIFMSSLEALEHVHGFPGFKMKKFREYEEAEEYLAFNQVYSSDEEYETESEEETWYYAVAIGRYTGIYMDWEVAKLQVHGFSGSRMKKFLDHDEALKYLSENRQNFGEEEEEKSEEEEEETWYYAVAVGRRVGIYTDHQSAIDQVHGYSNFRMRKFLDYGNALEYLASFSEEEEDSEEESEPEPEEDEWYYAVAAGRSPGIYKNHEDAMEQVHCYSGFRMKKFQDYDQAQEYIDFNQVYSSSEDCVSDEETDGGEETWYYAVAVGRSTGVYTNWQTARNQVHGYSGNRMKKFLEYDQAVDYIDVYHRWGKKDRC
ncbi:uncharacterized protein PITG_10250 [Phytophthora infestans T30-4]|uniref:ribonuclease H n=1 Tax=Phytophthora infestans (strain T30-4) TaxID=403677 RepID=D0NEW4_PHYIT|nr:uncharacterized protein PITG_10250 [Phytophthora infestans T30-4]EEY56753.1 conserved hypothetical protein [Phytophthora infestans T30-4]|eukprot:XP_002902081.1 conserved hypothetical protein [Phytophthora infestans T30-4]